MTFFRPNCSFARITDLASSTWCACLICFTFWISTSSKSHAQFLEVKCEDPELICNNHVGNEWSHAFESGVEYYSIYKVNLFPLSTLTKVRFIVSEAKETYPDYAAVSLDIDPAVLEWGKSYSKTLELIIRESNGRYAGNTAKWKVTLHYRKIYDKT